MCSVVTNLALAAWGKKGVKMTSIMDFMPNWGGYEDDAATPMPSTQTVEEMADILKSIAGTYKVEK